MSSLGGVRNEDRNMGCGRGGSNADRSLSSFSEEFGGVMKADGRRVVDFGVVKLYMAT